MKLEEEKDLNFITTTEHQLMVKNEKYYFSDHYTIRIFRFLWKK